MKLLGKICQVLAVTGFSCQWLQCSEGVEETKLRVGKAITASLCLGIFRTRGERLGWGEKEVNKSIPSLLGRKHLSDCYRIGSVTFLLKLLKMANSGSFINMINQCPQNAVLEELTTLLNNKSFSWHLNSSVYFLYFFWSTSERYFQFLNSYVSTVS